MWGDLLNTAPPETVLMKSGHIGFATKTETRGKSEGRPCVCGGVVMHFLKKGGYVKGKTCSEMVRGDLIGISGRPLMYASELGTFNQAHAFWPSANKMMT